MMSDMQRVLAASVLSLTVCAHSADYLPDIYSAAALLHTYHTTSTFLFFFAPAQSHKSVAAETWILATALNLEQADLCGVRAAAMGFFEQAVKLIQQTSLKTKEAWSPVPPVDRSASFGMWSTPHLVKDLVLMFAWVSVVFLSLTNPVTPQMPLFWWSHKEPPFSHSKMPELGFDVVRNCQWCSSTHRNYSLRGTFSIFKQCTTKGVKGGIRKLTKHPFEKLALCWDSPAEHSSP